ncbi:conserved domain protein [Limosilactobacillus oris F0423]|uniref:Conserved domain protein n=1 Tax=Limosilactobacillus oris F0423 TaxID=944562 RepID=A0ABP2LAS1_9LACO|nr:hypothetical protein [Limosilactobacillus oris]EGS38176.1 conserved domain protein [Limosilactobacillus oris F0423]
MMTKEEQLKAVAELPTQIFSWISKRKKAEEKLEKIPVGNTVELSAQYWYIDLYNGNFASEMGWI